MSLLPPDLPSEPIFATAALPGTAGRIKCAPEDFQVEEVPAFVPSGTGEHLYLWVEKRGLSTESLVRALGDVLDVPRESVGTAGLKDTQAVTRQWVSVPARAEAGLQHAGSEQWQILRTARHDQKLRRGQLVGNRFDVVIRDVGEDATSRAAKVLEHLQRHGLPNFFGQQRFGIDGDTAQRGFDLLRGGRAIPGEHHRRGFMRRLALSAAQSLLFNAYLRLRAQRHGLGCVLPGEVVLDRALDEPRQVFDVEAAQAKLEARRWVPAGPLFGSKLRQAKEEAGRLEAEVLKRAQLTLDAFEPHVKLAPGGRRPILVWPEEVHLEAVPEGLRLRFQLPAGSYATVLLGEVMKV